MRETIIEITIAALNAQGYPTLTLDSIRTDPAHKDAFLVMLGDCRPIPVVLKLMTDAENGRL